MSMDLQNHSSSVDSLPTDTLQCVNTSLITNSSTTTSTTTSSNTTTANFNSQLYHSYKHLSLNLDSPDMTPPPTISHQSYDSTQIPTISDEFGDTLISPTYSLTCSFRKQQPCSLQYSPLQVRRNLQAELEEQAQSPTFHQKSLPINFSSKSSSTPKSIHHQDNSIDENDDLNTNDYIVSPALETHISIDFPNQNTIPNISNHSNSKDLKITNSTSTQLVSVAQKDHIHSPEIQFESNFNPTISNKKSIQPIERKENDPLIKWKTIAIEQAGYNVIQLINEGSFGTVLKAQKQGLEGWVAIKVINKVRLSNKEIDSIRKQTMTLRSLSHRYIVQFYEEFEDDDYFYHVFEYLHGGDLYDRLEERGKPFSEAQALFLARQFLYAVSYLHSRNAAHRDIKLENFVFETSPNDQRQVMKLIDFDLLIIRGKDSPRTVMCNDMCGTILYVSPEIASAKEHVPEESDMWACGVMLYVLLSYQMPFQGETGAEILRAVRSKEPHFNPAIWAHISPDTKQLVKDLLRKHGADRPTADEALERVKEIQSLSREVVNRSRLRTFTQGLRSVSLNIWDPSGSLLRRTRPEQRRSSRHQSRRTRPNLSNMDETSSTTTNNTNQPGSYRASQETSRRNEGDNQPPSWRYSIGDRKKEQRQQIPMPVQPFEKEERFGSHEFLTSPALGQVMGRKRSTQTNDNNNKKNAHNHHPQGEPNIRLSRRLTKGAKLGQRMRNWIQMGRDGRRGRNPN